MTDRMEIQGKTVDEAVAEALLQMGARQDEVEITVLEEPKSGFMGILGNRLARVLVRRKPRRGRRKGNPLGLDDGYEAHDLSSRPSGGSRRGRSSSRPRTNKEQGKESGQRARGRGRNGAARTSQPVQEKAAPSAEETTPNSGSRRRRGRRGKPQGDRPQKAEPPRAVEVRPNRPEKKSRSRNEHSGPRNGNQRPAAERSAVEPNQEPKRPRQAPPEPDQIIKAGIQSLKYAKPIRGIAADQVDATLGELTEGMLLRAGFTCRCEVQPGEYSRVKLVTDDASAGMLIGRHGTAIDAVEHLIERMAGMAAGERVKMNLDINNYRRRREEALLARVQGIIAQVQESNREVHLESMSARERRIVHLGAAEAKGLKTYTVAGAKGKHVVVAPADDEVPERVEPEESAAAPQEDVGNQRETQLPEVEERPLD